MRTYETWRGLRRGVRRRCPLCGEKDVFRTWLETRAACPTCGLLMDRGESDFFLGAFTINFIVAELLVVGFVIAALVLTWPDVPWDGLVWAGAPLVVLAPILFYPFSRTIWLALDLMMRPPDTTDFEGGDRPGGRVS